MRALEAALRGEADAAELLRRASIAPPQATHLAVGLMIVFARLGSPCADAAFGAAELDGPGNGGVSGDSPVEAVAAEIGHVAAGFRVFQQGVEGARRMIFRMRTGQYDAVGPQQVDTFFVQIL